MSVAFGSQHMGWLTSTLVDGPDLAQVFFHRPPARKWESSNSSHLHISDLSASLNDPDTHRKSGLELWVNGEWGEAPETQVASGFAAF